MKTAPAAESSLRIEPEAMLKFQTQKSRPVEKVETDLKTGKMFV
jgi:hypothetical protein